MSNLTSPVIQQLEQLVDEVAQREGVTLYDLEFVGRGRQRVLRIFIDSDTGVSIDDCANVSRGLNVLLDAEDLIPDGAYELEISSPGLERQLRRVWHYEKAVGQIVRVKTNQEIPVPDEAPFRSPPKLKTLEGELIAANELELVLKKEELNWVIPMTIVHKANVVFVDPNPKHQKQKLNNKKQNKKLNKKKNKK